MTAPAPRTQEAAATHDATDPTTGAGLLQHRHPFAAPLAIAIIALIGSSLLLYPAAANWFASYQQSHTVDGYLDRVHATGPAGRRTALTEAAKYNAQLSGGTPIEAGGRTPHSPQQGEVPGYGQELEADHNGLMARLRIPAIGADLPIYHGTSDTVLANGIGHLEGTALPVGGRGTHAVLTGHRGLASAELFTRLNQLQVGNRFTISVFGRALTYRIINTTVIEPNDTKTLAPVPGQDLVTLVTCTPLGINSHRILVTGARVLPTPAQDVRQASQPTHGPGAPVWLGGALIVLLLLGGYVWSSSRKVPRTPTSRAALTSAGRARRCTSGYSPNPNAAPHTGSIGTNTEA